jgi:hypothetical protein
LGACPDIRFGVHHVRIPFDLGDDIDHRIGTDRLGEGHEVGVGHAGCGTHTDDLAVDRRGCVLHVGRHCGPSDATLDADDDLVGLHQAVHRGERYVRRGRGRVPGG